jgi:hypothetical protein
MTKDQVFELAKQAGFSVKNFKPPVVTAQHSNGSWVSVGDELERFAQLVRNSALESAAVEMQGLYTYGGDDVAAVIRAMKEQIK